MPVTAEGGYTPLSANKTFCVRRDIKPRKENFVTKRELVVLVLAALSAGGIFAQETENAETENAETEKTESVNAGSVKTVDWYNSYATVVRGDNIFINAGIGGLVTLMYQATMPTISASAEYGLKNIPISLGVYIATIVVPLK